jgi:hypothetical protein
MADWTIEEFTVLRERWEAGDTGQQIADLFGNRSRSAVIAKARQAGFKQPPKPKKPKGQLLSKGYRKAFASQGDDMRARFVRVDQGDGEHGRKRRQNRPRLPGFESPFIQEGRTKFPKAIGAPDKDILVSGYNNIKIGKVVTARFFKGYKIYTLSLEERKTCPASCQHWQTCYGNNMPFAKRVDHTAPDFLEILEAAVAKLCNNTHAPGILIRLHALGDFFSAEYVDFWRHRLCQHENLAIYGYTAHPQNSHIGMFVHWMNEAVPGRSMIRFSNGGLPHMSTVSIGAPESRPSNAFICPEQTGKSVGCDACGACWGTRKNVAFLEH